ncbi:MAG: crossover junction endodeoxyribonuclease RuvC [candidate division KSB1 bacterium]|nr:crossover junction endodeoxyribonuclease RuvC [candidate division KSB1 bacterium]MDZ7303089.1 crossover junction endodeoxyribonuclease RuvC [candidate division KSB1 bacterium]MDZ7312628.1 crossover junction endodeoxyribonuclease RuvC [candidate division KSB1 bacterium]
MHKRPERRFLGVDPGLSRTGLGLIRLIEGHMTFGGSQLIAPSPNQSLRDRLHQLYMRVQDCLREWRPEVMVMENLIYARNAQVALKLGQAHGVLLLAAAENNLPVVEYAPREVKLALTGHGGASKDQIQRMVRAVLEMPNLPEPYDIADALALAICHAHRCPDVPLKNTPEFPSKNHKESREGNGAP